MLSYRNRMIVFIFSFLLIAGILSGLAFYVLTTFGETLDAISESFDDDLDHDRVMVDIGATARSVKAYARSGNSDDYDRFLVKMRGLEKDFMSFAMKDTTQEEVDYLMEAFVDFKGRVEDIASYREHANGRDFVEDVDRLIETEAYLGGLVMSVHFKKMHSTTAELRKGHAVRAGIAIYIYSFIALCLISSAFLLIYMRRAVEEPADIILEATGRVISGELGYRISEKRDDEFGLIFNRFNHMVENLEFSTQTVKSRLDVTQLILAIGTLSSEGRSLSEVFSKVSSLVAELLNKDVFAIFVHDPETFSYNLSACLESQEAMEGAMRFVEDSSLVKRLLETKAPFVLESSMDSNWQFGDMLEGKSCLVVAPAVHDNDVLGFVVMGAGLGAECTPDEVDTANVLAATVGVMIRNHTLHEETSERLRQLTMIFELAKEITSLYEPEDLLDTISRCVAGLIHSRGCIVRLKEGDMLVPKSFYGKDMESAVAGPLKIGEGVPGLVAVTGTSLLINDVDEIPDDMKDQISARKTALVVPMKKDDVIIGTLGIVDKLDADGQIIQFSRSDLELTEGFASISALAIDKSMTHMHGVMVEAEMAKAEKRMGMLFDNVQVGIITLDENYIIKSANKFVERWADMSADDMLLRDAREVFHRQGEDTFICPHCAARSTFEEGGIYSINMSRGLNYAELVSYPLKDEIGNIKEAIVVIQDTTARVLYEEDIMGLYREVMQANEYIESLIRNSADAIVTTELDGTVQTWNPAAEEIFGFKSSEVKGKFLPYVPEAGIEAEHENMEKIRRGEVLNLETFRRRKDAMQKEVSMTLSPIKDISGEIIGISHISRDITEKKRVQKELIRRNQELSRLFFISSAMRGTLDLERVLYMVLITVTMSDGLGFNRAVLFLVDEETQALKAELGVGPATSEEASRIWQELSRDGRSLPEIMRTIEEGPYEPDSLLKKLGISLEIPLSDDSALAISAREKRVCNITGSGGPVPVDLGVEEKLDSDVYACVPLLSRGHVIGVLWVDNKFNSKPITDEDVRFLVGFADQVASAIEAARLFTKVSLAEAELENIFSSITDMVYFTGNDYTIKNVNQAVLDKLGLERKQVVGHKCFKIFHGMDKPWPACPHSKTVETLTPHVLEVEDKHMGGTFISSTAPMFGHEGEFMGTVHVVRDISELKDLRVKLQSAERKAALGEVAAKVAHEIRNPLVSVGGFARRLESKLEGTPKEYASIIATEASRLEAILKDILGFVREVRMHKRLVDLNEIIRSVLDLMRGEFEERGNSVVENFYKGGVFMFIDQDRVREAIMNMVVNANQAVQGGTITLTTQREGSSGVFTIQDSGEGVAEEDMTHIFDPFYTTRTMGTGLGLAVTKRIIEENDGVIQVEDRPVGSGAVFRVYLPIEEGDYEDTGS